MPEYAALLREHDVGMVIADAAGLWPELDDVTSDVAYVRLHGDRELYVSGYGAQALARWAERIRGWSQRADVYVYFDNDVKVHAPHDAMSLADLLGVGTATST